MWECYEEFQWFSNGGKSTSFNTERTNKKIQVSLFSVVVHKVSQWGGNTLKRILNKVHGRSNALKCECCVCVQILEVNSWERRRAKRSGGGFVLICLKELCHLKSIGA